MIIRNVSALNDFVAVLDACESQVWLESPAGSRWNLKSLLSQYLALDILLSNQGCNLEITCCNPRDELNFNKYFQQHPEAAYSLS